MVDNERGEGCQEPAPAEEGAGSLEGEPDEISRYRQILSREPTSLLFAALADAYRKRSLLTQAVEICKRGLRANPYFVNGRIALARAYLDQGEKDLAAKELEKVVLNAPENLVAQRLLAKIYRSGQHLDPLEKTLHRILSVDANDEKAREGLCWIEEQRGLGQEAAEQPFSVEIVTRTLAEIYASQGYNEKAYQLYRKLSRRHAGDPSIHARLADLKELIVQRSSRSRAKDEQREGQASGDTDDGASGVDRGEDRDG